MLSVLDNLDDLVEILYKWFEDNCKHNELDTKKIFLKPNMGYPKPAPFTTSIDLIKSVVEVAQHLELKEIIIGEGSTSYSSALQNFKETGLKDALKKLKVTFIDLDEKESISVKLSDGAIHYIPKFLSQIDIKISMPVIKFYDDEEGNIFLSNAIKNFFGLPPKEKYQSTENSYQRDRLHEDLHKSVAEIFLAVQKYAPFDLHICDGINILIGGAEEGEAKKWGKILIANDAIEADLKVLELLNKPKPRFLEILLKNK